MSTKQFTSLVDMQETSCKDFANNKLFGTKRNGNYEWITYKEFAEKVDQCRAALAALGVTKGNKVAVIADNRVEWAVAAYATYGLNAHYVPMYESQLPKDWKFIIEDSDAVVLLAASTSIYDSTKDWPGEVGQLQHVLCFDAPASEEHSFAAHLKKGAQNPVDSASPSADEVAGLIYTSGTTGKPKGVVLSHGNFISNVNAIHKVFPMSDEDVSLSFLPWAHSFGQTAELHVLLSMGAGLGLAESPRTLLDNFAEVRPTLLFSVPRVFNRIYDGLQKRMAKESAFKKFMFQRGIAVATERRKLTEQGKSSFLLNLQYRIFDKLVFSKVRDRFGGRMRYAFSGGAALSKEVAEFIDNMNIVVFEGYGLTETSPIVCANRPGSQKIGTVGKTIPGVEVFICDENQKVQATGTEGEVVVVGPNVLQEYHKRPDATEEVIFDLNGKRAFRTGDMGRLDDQGYLSITGRFKEQYKLENGKYVVPSPLEEQLKLSGFLNQVFVYGMNKPYNVALVVPDFPALEEWAKDEGISDLSPEGLIANPKVHAKIGDELAQYGAEFKGYERPKKWALLKDEFSVENDMMTPKMSIKRRNVIKTYQSNLDELYES
ncbi:MAG: long-chain fatty acid--CoA ligase [Deltaproteobacteria bacterium]|nr:MAG: long-chain fatty acid--CoA ligase [Deltaproteobacteria bacterium]